MASKFFIVELKKKDVGADVIRPNDDQHQPHNLVIDIIKTGKELFKKRYLDPRNEFHGDNSRC